MINKEEFLSKHLITDEEFESSHLSWEKLVAIYTHFESVKYKLAPIGNSFGDIIGKLNKVYIVSMRIKDGERLIAKIIRYVSAQKITSDINEKNYFEYINDLIGVRVIYNFKSEWLSIHKEIMNNFRHKLVGKAIIYHLYDDVKDFESYKNSKEFELKSHELGYRSVNYTIESDLLFPKCKVDVQLMTMYEAAWNNIFDNIKLRRDADIPIVNYFLKVLRDMSNTADNLASQISFIRDSVLNENDSVNTYNFMFHTSQRANPDEYSTLNIKELISQSRTDIAISVLLDKLKNDAENLNFIVSISSRFKSMISQVISGTIGHGEMSIETQKINQGLLELIDKIDTKNKRKNA